MKAQRFPPLVETAQHDEAPRHAVEQVGVVGRQFRAAAPGKVGRAPRLDQRAARQERLAGGRVGAEERQQVEQGRHGRVGAQRQLAGKVHGQPKLGGGLGDQVAVGRQAAGDQRQVAGRAAVHQDARLEPAQRGAHLAGAVGRSQQRDICASGDSVRRVGEKMLGQSNLTRRREGAKLASFAPLREILLFRQRLHGDGKPCAELGGGLGEEAV
jgi:hypothetical protein